MSVRVSLSEFREELHRQGLNAFLVPMDDAHMGEYSPSSERRITALSGFLGSAGFIVVTLDSATIWTDSRYLIAIKAEVDESQWTIRNSTTEAPMTCLADYLKPGDVVGYDAAMQTVSSIEAWTKAVATVEARLQAVETNPVDAIWSDQPTPPATAAVPHGAAFTGKSSADKRAELAAELAKSGLKAQVLNQSESVAWLLNVRGDDIKGLPVARSFATLHDTGDVDWYIAPERVSEAMHQALDNHVALYHPDEMLGRLGRMSGAVGLDFGTCNAAIANALKAGGATVKNNTDPVIMPRAIKNQIEQQGARDAQRRDARAVIRFGRWLVEHADITAESELSVIGKILALREENNDAVPMNGESFGTIAGFRGNAAMGHYSADETSNATLAPGGMLLVDSGGQYYNGTTDITRVWAIGGESTARQRRDYTLTLQGHLALERAVFPKGTHGCHLDVLARQFMWAEGIDFQHGTGHGIGSYLGVHEGPQRISKNQNAAALVPGMLVTNEPGIYREGESGVRIENVELVIEREDSFLAFETLTLVPYDRALIEVSMLSDVEIAQVDAYHARVLAEVGPDLDGGDLAYLEQVTSPLA
ncbi:aminopeptidase P family protein [Alphaproteobacteria bacterium]|nr:aminopeptidase P family protein [Alphaproteobacteria bacterium]